MLGILPFFVFSYDLDCTNVSPCWRNDDKKKINFSRLTVPSVKAYLYPCLSFFWSFFYFVANMTYLSVHFALAIPLYCQGRCLNECLLCKSENVKTQGSCRPIAAFQLFVLFVHVCSFLCLLRCVVQPIT